MNACINPTSLEGDLSSDENHLFLGTLACNWKKLVEIFFILKADIKQGPIEIDHFKIWSISFEQSSVQNMLPHKLRKH